MEDRHSDPAFERVVNTPTRGIGDKTLEGIRQLAGESNVFVAGRERRSCQGHIYRRVNGAVGGFVALIDEMADAVAPMQLDRACRPHSSGKRTDGISQPRAGERGLARKENLQNWCRLAGSSAAIGVPF